jgi:cytochrome b pre-mRNA-processing protein 3
MLKLAPGSKQARRQAARLYHALAARAREPEFFASFGVADTLDGRFDLLALHAWLVLDRLAAAGASTLAQALVDTVFVGFDEGLRELGNGEIGVMKRMKTLAGAFYGRLQAYDEAKDAAALEAALIRNLYRGAVNPHAKALARYVLRAKDRLATCEVESGELDFGPLPDREQGIVN